MPHPTDDAWNWRLHLDDGSTFDEFTSKIEGTQPHPLDPDAWQDHGVAEVEPKRVVAVELVPAPNRPDLPHHFVLVDAPKGARYIFFRRRLSPGVEGMVGRINATVIGWQRTIGRGGSRRNIKSLTCFLDNGSSFTTDSDDMLRDRLLLVASMSFFPQQ